ncbi:MAG TPA: GLPGLI family protein [Moheibacter sp.]|nr:GLPGLI family protein [Moheibacter sp.]
MKRLILFFIFIFTISFTWGQNNLMVVYNTSTFVGSAEGVLIAGKTTAQYEEGLKSDAKSGEVAENSFSVGGFQHTKIYQDLAQPNAIQMILYKSNNHLSANQKDYFILDELPEMKWEIDPTEKTTDIQGYACKEATVNFRGSRFKAYFTTAIPTPFGPWKFHGLPGLILKVISLDNSRISWEAEQIIYPSEVQLVDDRKAFDFDLTLKEYTIQIDKINEERSRAVAAKSGNTFYPIPDHMKRAQTRERKYEWETW